MTVDIGFGIGVPCSTGLGFEHVQLGRRGRLDIPRELQTFRVVSQTHYCINEPQLSAKGTRTTHEAEYI